MDGAPEQDMRSSAGSALALNQSLAATRAPALIRLGAVPEGVPWKGGPSGPTAPTTWGQIEDFRAETLKTRPRAFAHKGCLAEWLDYYN